MSVCFGKLCEEVLPALLLVGDGVCGVDGGEGSRSGDKGVHGGRPGAAGNDEADGWRTQGRAAVAGSGCRGDAKNPQEVGQGRGIGGAVGFAARERGAAEHAARTSANVILQMIPNIAAVP